MLEKKGGWNNEPMPRLNYLARTPYRWTQLALDKSFSSLEKALDSLVVTASTTGDSGNGDSVGAFRSLINELKQDLAPYVRPIITTFEDLKETVRLDPRVAGVIQLVNDLEEQVNTMENSATSSVKESITDIIDRYGYLYFCYCQFFTFFDDRLSLLIPELPGPSSDDFAIPKESQIDQESSPVESINELDDNSNSTPDQGALPSVDEEVYSSGDDEVTRFLKLKHSVPVSKAFEDVKVEAGKPSLFSIDSVPSKTPPVDDASTIVSAVGEKPWLKKRVAPVHSVESAVEVSDNTDMDNFETRKLQRIQRYKQWQPADIDIDVADVTTNDERIRGRRAMKLSNVEREMANRKVAELKRSYRTLGQRV